MAKNPLKLLIQRIKSIQSNISLKAKEGIRTTSDEEYTRKARQVMEAGSGCRCAVR